MPSKECSVRVKKRQDWQWRQHWYLTARAGCRCNWGMLEKQLIRAEDGRSRRLMIVMHGLGDSMAGYRFLPNLLNIPALNYLLVNAPNPYYGGYSWYDFMGDEGPGVARSRKLLFDLLDELQEAQFRTEEMVIFGFSQGCLMAIEMGARAPYAFAGVIGVSGYVHAPERLVNELSPVAKDQRFLVTHGIHDRLIPIDQVRGQIELLQSAGLQIEWREFEKDHTISPEDEVETIRDFVLGSFPTASRE